MRPSVIGWALSSIKILDSDCITKKLKIYQQNSYIIHLAYQLMTRMARFYPIMVRSLADNLRDQNFTSRTGTYLTILAYKHKGTLESCCIFWITLIFFDPDTTWCVLIQRNVPNVGEDTREMPMIHHAQRPAECATQNHKLRVLPRVIFL
jgi:hypothetical protein